MNHLENWVCGSWMWRRASERYLLPGLLMGWELGDHVLELGAGLGAGTEFLRRRTSRLTSLEPDGEFVRKLVARFANTNVTTVRGDAASLPFPAETFSAAIATLVLHHLPSTSRQDAALAEVGRVLRPGGIFLALEVSDGRMMRLVHGKDTYVPLNPGALPARLTMAGFSRIVVDLSRTFYQLHAVRGDGNAAR